MSAQETPETETGEAAVAAKSPLRRLAAATWSVAALLAAVTVVAPGARAASALVEPGDKIVIANGNGESSACTAGPYVQRRNGQTGILTAGHCGAAGEPVYVSHDGTRIRVGAIGLSVDDDYSDVAFIPLDARQMSPKAVLAGDDRVVGGIAPAAMLTALAQNADNPPILCSKGIATGERCGRVDGAGPSGLIATMVSNHGDSGSTVWATTAKGSNLVVGLLRGTKQIAPEKSVIQPIEAALNLVKATLLVSG